MAKSAVYIDGAGDLGCGAGTGGCLRNDHIFSLRDKRMGIQNAMFFSELNNHIYRHNGEISSYGMKYFTDVMIPGTNEMKSDYPCKAKERASGATSAD